MKKHTILVYGGGGRLDQEMCNLNALYQISNEQYRRRFHCSVTENAEEKAEGVEQNDKQNEKPNERSEHKLFENVFRNEEYRILMITPYSCATMLVPGKHTICRNEKFEKEKCALIPLGAPVWNLRTTGLKWNIDHHVSYGTNSIVGGSSSHGSGGNDARNENMVVVGENSGTVVQYESPALQFGVLVSTSNEFDENNFVTVDTSDTLLWTWTIKDHSSSSNGQSSLSRQK